MRVTGGALRGRRLRAPRQGVRPTSDRVREAVFAVLGDLAGARVLDLYAGAGTLGIEALSRGAASVVFVERAERSVVVLRANLEELALEPVGRILRSDAVRALRRLADQEACFDLVFVDPPYASDEAARALSALADGNLLAPEATVVVEASRRHPVAPVEGLVSIDERRYGDTLITLLTPRDAAPCGEPGRSAQSAAGGPEAE